MIDKDITPIERKWLDGRDIQALKDEYELAYWTEEANKASKLANQWTVDEMIRVQEYNDAGFGHILDDRYGPTGPPMSQVQHTKEFLNQPLWDDLNEQRKMNAGGVFLNHLTMVAGYVALLVIGIKVLIP